MCASAVNVPERQPRGGQGWVLGRPAGSKVTGSMGYTPNTPPYPPFPFAPAHRTMVSWWGGIVPLAAACQNARVGMRALHFKN
jgi:hypothetical protein